MKPQIRSLLALVCAASASLLIIASPAQAGGYTVTLQQVGPNVVATGSGAIDLTGLTVWSQPPSLSPEIRPNPVGLSGAFISTGPISCRVDRYRGAGGPSSFGSAFVSTFASSGSGNMVGIENTEFGFGVGSLVSVPMGYVSGTALSDMSIYSGSTLVSLGVTPGTYVWTWGAGANQNFTLKILSEILPAANVTNVSARGFVGTGQGVIIAGFISNGSTQVMVRGLGPTLAARFNIAGALADPVVSLFDGDGNLVSTNKNWKDTQQAEIEATGRPPPNDLEAAILAPVSAGNYTAILSDNGGATGIGLIEVYKQ